MIFGLPNLGFSNLSFFIWFLKKNGLLIGKVARCCWCCSPSAADIPAVASIPGDVTTHNVPVASAVAFDSTLADLINEIGTPWVPAVVIVSAFAGIPTAAVVLTDVDVPSATGVSNVLASLLLLASLLWLTSLLLVVFPPFLRPWCWSLLLFQC